MTFKRFSRAGLLALAGALLLAILLSLPSFHSAIAETAADAPASVEGGGTCRCAQACARLAVKVALVGLNPGALKNPLAANTTPTPSPD